MNLFNCFYYIFKEKNKKINNKKSIEQQRIEILPEYHKFIMKINK